MISFEEVQLALQDRNYRLVNLTNKVAAYCLDGASPVYVNRTSRSGASSLVVHPEAQLDMIASSVEGLVTGAEPYHNSNLKLFPKRLNTGKKEIHYGQSLSFESNTALNATLDFLGGAAPHAPPTPVDFSPSYLSAPGFDVSTMAKRRVGHASFKDLLVKYWKGCAVSGSTCMPILRASHIKPWELSDPLEKTDLFNGLLLAPNLDAAFDIGLISFEDSGELIISPKVSEEEQTRLGFSTELALRVVDPRHIPYLSHHRDNIFQR